MDEGLLSIGKMAAMNHLTVATLRLYDELGLLSPRYKGGETGYRLSVYKIIPKMVFNIYFPDVLKGKTTSSPIDFQPSHDHLIEEVF